MRVPTTKTLTTCIGIGVVAVAAIAIPAWAKSGEDSSGESGSVERAEHPPPFGAEATAQNRRRFRQDLEEFRDCMGEQGVDLPEPPGPRGGFAIPAPPPGGARRGEVEPPPVPGGDREAFEAAVKRCGGPPFPRPPFGARLRGEFHECAAALPRRHR